MATWQGSDLTDDWSLPISVLAWVRSFIEPDLFENNVPFDNTTPIYLINLLWKLGLRLGLDSEFHYFSIFTENDENEHLIFPKFTDGNILLKERTQTIKNEVKITYSGSVHV